MGLSTAFPTCCAGGRGRDRGRAGPAVSRSALSCPRRCVGAKGGRRGKNSARLKIAAAQPWWCRRPGWRPPHGAALEGGSLLLPSGRGRRAAPCHALSLLPPHRPCSALPRLPVGFPKSAPLEKLGHVRSPWVFRGSPFPALYFGRSSIGFPPAALPARQRVGDVELCSLPRRRPRSKEALPHPAGENGAGGDALLLLEVRGASIAVGGSLLFSERSNEESPIRQSGSPFLLQLTLSPVPRRPLLAFRSPLNSNRLSGCLPVVGWRLRGAPQRWGPALCQSYPPGAGAPSQSWEAGGMRLVPLFSPTGGSSWEMGVGC